MRFSCDAKAGLKRQDGQFPLRVRANITTCIPVLKDSIEDITSIEVRLHRYICLWWWTSERKLG